jgi:hypothetical protein
MTAAYGSHQLLGSHFEGMRFYFQVCEATAGESVAAIAKTDTTIMSLLHLRIFISERLLGRCSLSVKQGDFLRKTSKDELPVTDGKMRVRVQIARKEFQDLCGYFLEKSYHRSAESLAVELFRLPYEPYAPIIRQQLNLLRLINKKRQHAGFEKLSPSVLRYKRRIVSPFETVDTLEQEEGNVVVTGLGIRALEASQRISPDSPVGI